MTSRAWLLVVAMLFLLPACSQKPQVTSQPAETSDSGPTPAPRQATLPCERSSTFPAVKLFVNHRYAMREPGADSRPRLIAALWPDGRMVWSENATHGGPPYRSGTASAQAVDRMFGRLEAAGLFANGGTKWRNWGPDASFTVLDVEADAGMIHMESWHELMADRRSRAKTGEGIELPDLEEAADVELTKDQPGAVWDFVRASLTAMQTTVSEPTEIDIETLGMEQRSR